MPTKKKGRKGRKKKEPRESEKNRDARKELFQSYLDSIDDQAERYLKHMDEEYNLACQKIRKMYRDKLAELPKKYYTMTIEEYMEEQKKIDTANVSCDTRFNELCSAFDRKQTLDTTKKIKGIRSSKKLSTIHRRSLSCPEKNRKALAAMHQVATPLCSRSRVLSEAMLVTPLARRQQLSKIIVTPKFNPRTPLKNAFCRRPRAGEIVMSLSGSPIQNFADEESDAPGVIVKLGKGKVININEDTNIDNTTIKGIDNDTKEKVKNMQEKLRQILCS